MNFEHYHGLKSVIARERIFGVHHDSGSLPQVVGEDCQSRPDSGCCRALSQHSAQAELAFKHTDRGFYATAKALQLSEPLPSLMAFFTAAQATHFRNTNFLNTGLAKFQHVFTTVVPSIRGQFLRLYAKQRFLPVAVPKAVQFCRWGYPREPHSEQ